MYVDGFILAVPNARMDEYRRMAEIACEVWKENGAIDYVEAVADDVPLGERTSFPRAVELGEGETVVFSYITYADRAARDACMAAVMADPRIKGSMADMPFDGKRMIFGGFEVIVRA